MIEAKVIADSIYNGKRITSFVITMPRIVLAELNTHRALSKNSASSRAIPFAKMLEMVKTNPFIPIAWMKEHKGMQGTDYFMDVADVNSLQSSWLTARDNAVASAEQLNSLGLTKQIVNRILEPFMWHTVIITGTDWENFFALRAHEAAEIHIQKLAYLMLEALNISTPKNLNPGEWHIPFGDNIDETKVVAYAMEKEPEFLFLDGAWGSVKLNKDIIQKIKAKIATARCARVSYTVVGEEGKPDNYENDVKLHDRLLSMGHLSPFEHCAIATDDDGYSGNFRGWTQYRKTLPDENRNDSRVIIK